MEMRRPTEFGWDILVMKFKMWDRRVRGVTTEEEKQDAASLLQDILLLKEVNNHMQSSLAQPLLASTSLCDFGD